MFRALFYKEWCKTKRSILLILIAFTCAVVYTFIGIGQVFRVSGATSAWSDVILKDVSVLPQILEWIPLLAGMLLALSQFVPEMVDKRLKLTLHLPVPETKIITAILLYGTGILIGLYLLTYVVLLIGVSLYYPLEVQIAVFWRSLPWFLAGIIGYLLTAWIVLEPTWKQRIFNALISVCVLYLFYAGAKSGAYITFVPYLIVITIISFAFPFYSTSRFKDGAL